MERFIKESFAVIGKEGSTAEGAGFVQRLWAEANSHFAEAAPFAKKAPDGSLAGIWGAMSDFSGAFLPWEDGFAKGLYLAGIECEENSQPPEGWVKWVIPGFEFLRVKCDREDTFRETITYLQENKIPLAGAVQDFTCPRTGECYMLFPIRRL